MSNWLIGKQTIESEIKRYLAAYLGRYVTPIYIGVADKIQSGTASLVEINERRYIITCEHVFAEYQRQRVKDERVGFQVDGVLLQDLTDRVIDTNSIKDLCVLDAAGIIFREDRVNAGMPPLEFYTLRVGSPWPRRLVSVGDFVSFGGFPGPLRRYDGRQVASGLFTASMIRVTGTSGDYFTCNVDRNKFEIVGEATLGDTSFAWGGLSGCAVFFYDAKVIRPELVGFVSEHLDSVDQLKVRDAALINADGTIECGTLR